MGNARSVWVVVCLASTAFAQTAGKKYHPGEYDVYNLAVIDVNSNNFSKAVSDLDAWSKQFPETDYQDERAALYVQAYTGTNQPAKALASAAPLLGRDLATVFPGPTGPYTIVRLLFNAVYAIAHDPNPTPDEIHVGEKAAHVLMDYNQPLAGVSAADWEKARAGMKEQSEAALLHIAMVPGIQAMAQQPPDCAAADTAYTRALGAYPDKSALSYELGRALYCESKTQPDKLFAAIYEFQRAAAIDPTLGDPKGDARQVTSFADSAYVKVHGSDEGLAQLKQQVRQSALPPEGFHIPTAAEIAAAKQADFEKEHPQLALWAKIKRALTDADGQQYFESQLKDSDVPALRGTLVEAKPACRPSELLVAVPLPDSPQPAVAEIRLVLDKPLAGKPDENQEFQWQGVPAAFTRDPFLVTMDTAVARVDGLKTSPCPPAVRKK